MVMKRLSRGARLILAAGLALGGPGCNFEAPTEALPDPAPEARSAPVSSRTSLAATHMKEGIGPYAYSPDANVVVEASAPDLAALYIRLLSKESGENARELRADEDGALTGAIALPKESPAEYEIMAFDREGRITHRGEGVAPSYAQLDKPFEIPLHAVEEYAKDRREGIVLQLSREHLVLTTQPSPEDPEAYEVHAELRDARGERLDFGPDYLKWQLLDDRWLELRPHFDPFDIKVTPKKDFERLELCSLKPVVIACTSTGLCRQRLTCDDPWQQISAGAEHTCALTKSGAAYCWGLNNQGQLGAPTQTSCTTNSTSALKCSSRPMRVRCPAGAPCQFRQIAAGITLTVALDINGDVWWWGRGAPDHHKVNAVMHGSPVSFFQVTAGFGHGCAIEQARREIWCWGTNAFGEAGGLLALREIPDSAPVRALVPLKFRKVVAGGEHTCAIGDTGVDVVCWGRDTERQSSGPNARQIASAGFPTFHFQQFGGLVSIRDVAASPSRTCVTLPYGVQCWGSFWQPMPTGVPDQLAVSDLFTCALHGLQASCVGSNNWGELGIGSTTLQNTPVAVSAPPSEYAEITTGGVHACGLTPAGEAFCWGRNTAGETGSGTTSYSVNAPVKVVSP